MDPVMDRASQGFKDGWAAHLLKSEYVGLSAARLWQSMTFLLQANDVGLLGYVLLLRGVHVRFAREKVIKFVLWPFLMSWQLSAVYSVHFLVNECRVLERWYPPVRCAKSTKSNGEHCVVMHSPLRLLWGLSEKTKSTEELREWKMLVCQFVTKAVCSCVIDWQTVLARYPQGHTGYC